MGLLADTFREKLSGYLQAHAPTRVLVGGLPDFIIEAMATKWTSPYQLLLVTKAAVGPLPQNVKLCQADDLTAERQHAWAALVSSGESRAIQESIRSAGAGTVREIWTIGFPWHPCDLPGVRWTDVRKGFIDALGITNERDHVAHCIDQFRTELYGEVDASTRFFSALDNLTKVSIDYDKVCFQLGFPKHSAGRVFRARSDNQAVLHLLAAFVEKFKDEAVDEAAEQYKDIASTHYAADPALLTNVKAALDNFSKQFRRIAPADVENPIRAWRTIFQNDRAGWDVLSADVLSALLGPNEETPSFGTYEISSGQGIQLLEIGDNNVIVRDRNELAPSINAKFLFSSSLVTKANKASSDGSPWRLFAHCNRVSNRLADPLPGSQGPHTFPTPLPNEGKQSVRFSERKIRQFADFAEAHREAKDTADKLNAGRGAALELSGADRDSYLSAMRQLRPLDVPLNVAVAEYVKAKAFNVPIVEAVKSYAESHNAKLPDKSIEEVYQEMLAAKRRDGASEAYLHDLKMRLRRFSRDFKDSIANMTTADLDAWLRKLNLSPRSRNNHRNVIVSLFNFAKAAGYLNRDKSTAAEHTALAKTKGKAISFFSPQDMAKLLSSDDKVIRPMFVLGAFCGLRTAEILRLSWEDIRWAESSIVISEDVSKGGEARRRRIAPLTAPAAAWLADWKDKRGRVLPIDQPEHRVKDVCEATGVKWKKNGLRHSFITYRVATEKDFVRVAYEAGNSPAMIRSNYDAVATEQEGKLWFSVMPKTAENVIPMNAAAVG